MAPFTADWNTTTHLHACTHLHPPTHPLCAMQACGAPVSLSLPGSRTLEELHAAAAAATAATPVQMPEDQECSVARLLQAVRCQPDPCSAVTTALVALLHVPTRPRLAFPAGRPARQGAAATSPAVPATAASPRAAGSTGARPEAAAGVAGAAEEAAVGGKRKAEERDEQLPDGTNYLDPFPTVKALMDQFRCGGWWASGSVGLGLVGSWTATAGLLSLGQGGDGSVQVRRMLDGGVLGSGLLSVGFGECGAGRACCSGGRRRPPHFLPPQSSPPIPPPPPHLCPTCRARPGQDSQTPLAVVHEYAARLALRLEFEEAGTPTADGAVGPPFTGAWRASLCQSW